MQPSESDRNYIPDADVVTASSAPLRSRAVATPDLPLALARLLGFGQPTVIIETTAETDEWTPVLIVNAAVAVLIAAVAANASRTGHDWAVGLFYFAIALIYLPAAARIFLPRGTRQHRITLVLTVVIALFLVRVIRAPIAFIDHDEFLHWVTANDIIEQGRLFLPNALLPVSPLFPGLEIITTAIAELTGLSVFASAMVLLAICRVLFVATLFLAFERIAASARIASIACMIYMGSSTFLVFDAHFAYESLAVVFLALAILADTYAQGEADRPILSSLTLTVSFLSALAVTHHMTAFFAAGLFCAFGTLELIKLPAVSPRARPVIIAGFAVAMPLAWSHAMGNPTEGYLGPVIQDGLREVAHVFSSSQGREMFVSDDGSVAPAWQRFVAIGSVGFICSGLAIGFVRSLSWAGLDTRLRLPSLAGLRRWGRSRLVLLTLLTFAYPLSILFRLTRSGWEIGNRIGPFSFLGVALVVAIGVASFGQGASKSPWRAMALGAAATIIVIGGIISAEGPRILVPSTFRVSADAASVEQMGIATARWSQEWLGRNNLFASDRISRLLLATYGHQQVSTTLMDPRDASVAIQSNELTPANRLLLRQLGIEFVLADLRLTTALPVVGVYFDGGAADHSHSRPLAPKALLKFNSDRSISRPFDNGYEIIFDVRNIDAER